MDIHNKTLDDVIVPKLEDGSPWALIYRTPVGFGFSKYVSKGASMKE